MVITRVFRVMCLVTTSRKVDVMLVSNASRQLRAQWAAENEVPSTCSQGVLSFKKTCTRSPRLRVFLNVLPLLFSAVSLAKGQPFFCTKIY